MLTKSKLARAVLAAIALSAASTAANAFTTSAPDPFLGQVVDLQSTPPGTVIGLPGLGYTTGFTIDGFNFEGASGGVNSYSASFHSSLSDTIGGPVVRTANLTGTSNFVVDFVGRSNPFQTGIFDLVLNQASFSGTVNGQTVAVSLGNVPTAQVSIQNHAGGGYDITYLTAFQVTGQYTIDGGAPVTVPGLGDTHGQPPTGLPEPATALLMAPGLLAMLARRRRAAVAA